MSKNLSRRSWAIAAAIAMGVSTFSVMPAQAAEGDVTLLPTAGSNLGAFSTDDFEMDASVSTVVGLASKDLAIEILTGQDDVEITLSAKTGQQVTAFTFRAFDATGNLVDMDTRITATNLTSVPSSNGAAEELTFNTSERSFAVAMATANSTRVAKLVINEFKVSDATTRITESTVRIGIKALESDSATAYSYGDGAPKDVTIRAWIDTNANVSNVETNYASPSRTVNFYDPKTVSVIPSVTRFNALDGFVLNDTSTAQRLGAKLTFTQPSLNLDQVHFNKWNINGTTSATGRTGTVTDMDSATAPTGRKNLDDAGAAFVILAKDDDKPNGVYGVLDADLVVTKSYGVVVSHDGGASGIDFRSVLFTPPNNAQSTNRYTFVTVTDSENATQTAGTPGTSNDDTIGLRPGVESFTYKARLYDDTDNTRDKTASVSVLATVTANYVASGETLSVSGTNQTITSTGQVVSVTGLTNTGGDYSVTVTSSDASTLTKYAVQFYVLKSSSGKWHSDRLGNDSTAATFTATYGSVSAAEVVATNGTLSGANVTAEVTVKDGFGEGVSTSGTNPLYVTFQASDSDVLSETVAVDADGKASTTFANYVASGGADLMTARVHTGASYNVNNQLLTTVLSIYNPADASAVNVADSYTGVITYEDFITGAASSTNVAPDDDNRISTNPLAGTVVDADGSGVPGALVTVDAPGMQLRKSGAGNYFQDSITFAANAAGGFEIDMWAHTVDTTGVDVTITSGGQSATTTVKTYLPSSGVDGNNLVFTMDTPANIDVNRTYAMSATLTDKWGNPIKTSTDGTPNGVDFVGSGSVEINSTSAVVPKNFGKDGSVTVFVRSIKDIEGPGSITATLGNAAYTYWTGSATATAAISRTEITTDVAGTDHDETSFSNEISVDVNVGEAAATSSDQKVNAGSFKGYVALYAKGYEGQRMSAIVAGKWLQVDSLASDFERVVRFTGAGYDIKVRIYIDGEQVGPEFDILTK